MAKLYADDNGNLISFWHTDDELLISVPSSYTTLLLFDENTNSVIINYIDTDWNNCKVINNLFYHNDQLIDINPPGDEYIAKKAIANNYPLLPDWAQTGTADQAETYINNQIFGGQTQAQIEAYIDAQITNITTANVAQINIRLLAIRNMFKMAAGAIITLRGLFVITAKLLIYIRDLVLRFKKK